MVVSTVDINMSDRRSVIGPRENLRLSESEREYLETGEIPRTFSQQNIESCVRDTIQKLPARIDILAEDVELLDETSRETIPFEDWRECWFEVIGLEHKPTQREIEQAYAYSPSDETPYPTSGLVEFGEILGRLANILYMPKDGDEIDEGHIQMILGFVNAIYSMEDGVGSADYRKNAIDFVTRELTERSETLAQIDTATAKNKMEYIEESKDNSEKARKKIKNILKKEEIEPTPSPMTVIEKAKKRHITSSSPFESMKYRIGGDVQVEDEFTKETVLEIVEEENLCEKLAAWELIEDDFHRLIDTRWKGVEADEIIDKMFQNEKNNMSSGEINDALETQKDYSRMIAKLTADLCGRESPWDERPLIQKSGNGWELTNYGKAVADSFSNRIQFLGHDEPRPAPPSEELLEAAFEGL